MKIELIPLRSAVCSERSTTLDVLVRITPPEPEKKLERPALNIGLVIDRSGSMEGQKIEYARQAACYAVEQLLSSDRISVTIYDDRIDTLVPSTLATNKAHIIRQIQGISARNMTALHAGWLQGGVQVSEYLNSEHLNRVILLSDGLANVGETNPDVIASDVQGLAKRGVSTTTMGIGDDYNEDLLEAMARSGDGNYYYIRSPQQLPNIFSQELQGLMGTIGTGVTLGIEPQAGVEVAEVLNELTVNSKGRFQLSNLVVGSSIDVVVRLKIPAIDRETDLCYFRLAWNNPDLPERQKIRVGLRLPAVNAAELEEFPFSLEVRQQAALMMTARAKKEAVQFVDRGEYDRASQLLQETRQQLLNCPDMPMSAPEADALEDLDEQLKQREIVKYRKISHTHEHNRSRQHSSGHADLFYAYDRGPKCGPIANYRKVDAIVNSTDTNLSSNGAISSEIHFLAGAELLEECQRLNGCAVGEAKITSGYRLLRKGSIIHTVCPSWQGGTQGEEQILAQCYRNCLALAVQHSIHSIVFPALGTREMGFPLDKAAKIAFQETSRFLLSNSSIGKIIFVCSDPETHSAFQTEFGNFAGW
jgi:Ca-activated chloride channel homolog